MALYFTNNHHLPKHRCKSAHVHAIQRDLDKTERWANEPHEVQQGRLQGAAPGSGQFQAQTQARQRMDSPEKKDLGVLVNEKINISWQCVFAARKANPTLDCIKRNVASTLREVILPSTLL